MLGERNAQRILECIPTDLWSVTITWRGLVHDLSVVAEKFTVYGGLSCPINLITQIITMNIFERINQDHEKQRRLMQLLVETEGESSKRKSAFADFKSEYKAHAAAEEQVFYSTLMEDPDGTDKARHSVAEHKETLDLLEEIADTDMSSSSWLKTMKKIQHENEHHMKEEEDEVFPHARRVLDGKDISKMGDEFESRKKEELGAS